MEPANRLDLSDYNNIKSTIKDLKFKSRSAYESKTISSLSNELQYLNNRVLSLFTNFSNEEEIYLLAKLLHKIEKASKILSQNQIVLSARQDLQLTLKRNNPQEDLFNSNLTLKKLRNFFNLLSYFNPFVTHLDNLLMESLEKCDSTDIQKLNEYASDIQELKEIKQKEPQLVQEIIKVLKILKENQRNLQKAYLNFIVETKKDWEPQSTSYDTLKAGIIFSIVNIEGYDPDALLLEGKDAEIFLHFHEESKLYAIKHRDAVSEKDDFKLRIEFLKLLKKQLPEKKIPPIFIVGAGPAGLMRGLLASLHNIPFKIIEKREKSSGKSRDNTTMLGNFPLDLVLLKFFGVKVLAESKKEMVTDPFLNETCITLGDLEQNMRIVLEELAPNSIVYECTVTKFLKSKDGLKAVVGSTETNASMVMDCSGEHSSVRGMLGIQTQEVSKSTSATASFFEDSKDSELKSIKYEVIIAQQASKKVLTLQDVLKRYALMSRNKLDYVGIAITPDLAELRKKSKLVEASHLLPNLDNCSSAVKTASTFVNAWIEKESSEVRVGMELLKTSAYKTSHKPLYRVYRNGTFINLSMRKAESSYSLIAGTPCLICGDAESTTDPSSGRGASKAIASAPHDLFLMHVLGEAEITMTLMALWRSKIKDYSNTSHIESLIKRTAIGHLDNAYPLLYFEMAFDRGFISSKELERLSLISERARKGYSDTGDFDEIVNLRIRALNKVQNHLPSLDPLFVNFIKNALNKQFRINSENYFPKSTPKNADDYILIEFIYTIDKIMGQILEQIPALAFCRQM